MENLELLGITGTDALLLIGFVIGAVELVKAAFAKNWKSVAIIATAGVAGLIAGLFIGLPVLTGIVAGFAGSGVITFAEKFSLGGFEKVSEEE